jgi:hypothetical protein
MEEQKQNARGKLKAAEIKSILSLPPNMAPQDAIAFLIGRLSGKIDAALILTGR